MADRSHLAPSKTTDRNGKLTTVYRRADRAAVAGGRPVPPPVVSTPADDRISERARGYEERLAAISAANARWEAGDHPSFAGMRAGATERIGFFVQEAAQLRSGVSAGDYATLVGDLFNTGRYAPLLAAAEYCGVHMVFRLRPSLSAGDEAALARMKEKAEGGPEDLVGVMTVADRLINLGLMQQDEVPEIGHDARFFAHLRASATGLLVYSTEGVLDRRKRLADDQAGWIRLLDEYPEQYEGIAEAIRNGLPCETVRGAFEDGHPALLDGAL